MATTQGKRFDLIPRGGHVVDPAAGRDGLFDVGIRAVEIADGVVLPRFVLKDGVKYDPDSPLPPAPVEATRAAA